MPRLYRSYFTFQGQKHERTSTKSQREADRRADQYKKDLETGDVGISKNMRVSAWANEWLEVYKKPKMAEKSYKRHFRCIEKIITPQIGGLRLCDVTDIHLQKVMNSRGGYSFSEVKFLRDTLKAMFKKGRKSKLVVCDPAEDLDMPCYTKGTHRPITAHEREHFLKVADAHYAGLMFKVMLYCGLRTGEVTALSWKNIDFDAHMLNVVAAMESGTDKLKAPKTAAGVRKVPIPDTIYHELSERRGEPFAPVFAQETTGNRHTETSRAKAWRSFKNALDDSMGAKWDKHPAKDGKMRLTKVLSVVAPDLVPYCLRHTYCTDLQAKGVPIKIASYLMGHASIAVTANIYTHITEDAISNAAELIGATKAVTSKSKCSKTA